MVHVVHYIDTLITFKSRDKHIIQNEFTRFNVNDSMVEMKLNDIYAQF